MVVRASNLLYGLDACAYISSKVKSGYVVDLERPGPRHGRPDLTLELM